MTERRKVISTEIIVSYLGIFISFTIFSAAKVGIFSELQTKLRALSKKIVPLQP
jgi:hypothetical protein